MGHVPTLSECPLRYAEDEQNRRGRVARVVQRPSRTLALQEEPSTRPSPGGETGCGRLRAGKTKPFSSQLPPAPFRCVFCALRWARPSTSPWRSPRARAAAQRAELRCTVGVCDDGKPDRRHVERRTRAEVTDAVRELEKQESRLNFMCSGGRHRARYGPKR